MTNHLPILLGACLLLAALVEVNYGAENHTPVNQAFQQWIGEQNEL